MLEDHEFSRLLNHFDRSWSGYRKVRQGVKKRLRRHMEELGCGGLAQYLALIDQRPDVEAECLRHLAVTISRFMRDRGLWSCLQDRCLPELARRFPQGVRAWSAGCANGEEPYSLALAWQLLADKVDIPPMTILATDLRPDCLSRARQGRYTRGSLKELAPELRERFFVRLHDGRQYEVRSWFARPDPLAAA
jgi:chemotaxis protein methyltransferase CheR